MKKRREGEKQKKEEKKKCGRRVTDFFFFFKLDQIRTKEQQEATLATCEKFDLDLLVMVGGARTCSDATNLAEIFHGRKTRLIVVPAGIYYFCSLHLKIFFIEIVFFFT